MDVHVSDLAATRALFDPVMTDLGLSEIRHDGSSATYYPPGCKRPFVGFTVGEQIPRGGTLRAAFAARSRDQVDRLGAHVAARGARNVEGPQTWDEYAADYYAVFFEDADGNRFEIVYRG